MIFNIHDKDIQVSSVWPLSFTYSFFVFKSICNHCYEGYEGQQVFPRMAWPFVLHNDTINSSDDNSMNQESRENRDYGTLKKL